MVDLHFGPIWFSHKLSTGQDYINTGETRVMRGKIASLSDDARAAACQRKVNAKQGYMSGDADTSRHLSLNTSPSTQQIRDGTRQNVSHLW